MRLGRRAALVLAASSIAARPRPAVCGWAACSNRAAIPSAVLQAPAETWPTSRVGHLIAADVTAIRLVYANWYVGDDLKEVLPSGTLRVRAALQSPSGRLVACSFGGAPDVVIEPGGLAMTDPVTLDLQAGAVVSSRTAIWPSRRTWPGNVEITGGYGTQDGFRFATGAQPEMSSLPRAGNVVLGYGPCAVLGQGAPGACAIVGDSIAAGAGDRLGDEHKDSGFLERGLAGRRGFVNLARSGDEAASFVHGSRLRLALARRAGCTSAIVLYGTNDIGAGVDADGLKTSLRRVWQALADADMHDIGQCTILPRTASPRSDVPRRGYEPGGVRDRVNAWILSRPAPLSAAFDSFGLISEAGVWRKESGWPMTDDGTHPNTRGHELLARALERDPFWSAGSCPATLGH